MNSAYYSEACEASSLQSSQESIVGRTVVCAKPVEIEEKAGTELGLDCQP